MVAQVLTDMGQIGDNRNAMLAEMRPGSEARNHHQLWCLDGAAGEYDGSAGSHLPA